MFETIIKYAAWLVGGGLVVWVIVYFAGKSVRLSEDNEDLEGVLRSVGKKKRVKRKFRDAAGRRGAWFKQLYDKYKR